MGLTGPPYCPNLLDPLALLVMCVSRAPLLPTLSQTWFPTPPSKPGTGASMLSAVALAEREGGWAWERGLKGQPGGRLRGRAPCEPCEKQWERQAGGVGVPRGVADLFPRRMWLVLGGCGIPGLVLSAGGHPTLSVHRSRAVPGPRRVDFAPGTQPVGRAGECSGCGVVWCGVAWCQG